MNSQIKNKAVYWGTGRRKTSVARVRLIPGNDDAIRSIELIASAIADACLKGSGKRDQVENKESE